MAHLSRWLRGRGAGSASRALGAAALALGIAAGVALTGTPAAALPNYVLVDLGTFSNGTRSAAQAINASGQVAGWADTYDWWDPFLDDLTGMHDLGHLYAAAGIFGEGINDSGDVVGYGGPGRTPGSFAFLYSGGVLHDLGGFGGLNSDARAINNAGQVVGSADLAASQEAHACLYDSSGVHDLGTLGGATSQAYAINASGQVVGLSTVNAAATPVHAFLWEKGGMRDLGGLPGSSNSVAAGINDAGQIVGWSGGTSWIHACLYDATGVHDLGTLGGPASEAKGINNLGQIVGFSRIHTGTDQTQHAFLYDSSGMTDLNSLLPADSGWVLTEANGINDAGQIVGTGTLKGQQRAYLLTFPGDPRLSPPAAPSGLTVKMASTSELDLSWTNNSNNQHGFELQVKKADGQWLTIGPLPADRTTFTQTGLPADTHYTYRVRAVNDVGASAWSNEAAGDTGIHPHADLSPAQSLDFGGQAVGTASAAQTLTITNSGNGPLTIASLTVSGSSAGDFAVVPPLSTPRVVAPGESASLGLVYTPSGPGPGSATLTIADDAVGGPAAVTLTGSGVGPGARLSPTALDFGEQPVGLGTPLAVLLQNDGNAPLNVSRIAFQGPDAGDFSLATDGVSGRALRPGDIALLNVRFSPTATGSRTATLAITDDAAGSLQLITLTGTGTAPLLRASAASLVFSLQAPGATQSVSFTNHGDAPLAIQSVALGGPDAGSFQIVSDTGEASLAPGASRTLTVSFHPASVAAAHRAPTAAARIASAGYSATLEIKDNDPHPTSPHQIALVALAPPAAPGNLTATVTAGPQVQLTWSNPQPDPHAYLTVWRQEGSGNWTRIALLPGDATRFTDTSVSGNASYTYQAHWVNGPVVSPWSNLAHASTAGAALAPPSGLTATVGSGPQVRLTWSVPAPNPHAYLTLWRQAGSGEWTRVALLRGDARQFTDTSVQAGTSYTYHAHLVTDAAVSAWSNTATVSTPTAGPAQLSAAAGPGARVTLSWSNPHPDAHAWLTVWRQAGTGQWTRVALLHGDAASFTDTQVSAGSSYRYRAHRVDGADVSDWSNEAAVVLP